MNTDNMSNSGLHWNEFANWCKDNGVDHSGHEDDWETWWYCWSTAIATKIEAIEAEKKMESKLPRPYCPLK